MRTEAIRNKNSRGLGLAAVIERPEGDGRFPFVILLHGFTGWKEEKHITSFAQLLAENGIGSTRFDASGSGESEGTFFENYRFSNYLDDVEDIYKYLHKQNFVDNSHVGVWGHSMGGQIAVYFASKHPELTAMCSCQGSGNIAKSLRHNEQAKLWKQTGYQIFSNSHFDEIKLPYAFFDDRRHFDSAEAIKDVKFPKLFVAGTKDDLVTVNTVKEVYAAASEPKEFFEHAEADHFYKNHPDILNEINNRILEFFKNNL